MQYRIIDNFLPKKNADEISNTMLGSWFPWYYNNISVYDNGVDDINNYQLVHGFYNDKTSNSNYYNMLNPLISKLNAKEIIRVKSNLNPHTKTRHIFDWLVDFPDIISYAKTAIYYVNTNDGVTLLDGGIEIASVANRLLIFDRNITHTGTTCTDTKVRCLINLNYIEYNND